MAKRKFDYIAGEEEPWQPRAARVSRATQAEERDTVAAHVTTLLTLPASQWARLPLSEDVVEALKAHQRIKKSAHHALKRQAGRLAAMLRHDDLDALAEALEAATHGRSEREARIEALVRWRTRLVEGEQDDLTAFVQAFPNADRQRLRQLLSNARKATNTPGEGRAMRSLLEVLKDAAGLRQA